MRTFKDPVFQCSWSKTAVVDEFERNRRMGKTQSKKLVGGMTEFEGDRLSEISVSQGD